MTTLAYQDWSYLADKAEKKRKRIMNDLHDNTVTAPSPMETDINSEAAIQFLSDEDVKRLAEGETFTVQTTEDVGDEVPFDTDETLPN